MQWAWAPDRPIVGISDRLAQNFPRGLLLHAYTLSTHLTRELFESHDARLSSAVVVNLLSQTATSHGQYFHQGHTTRSSSAATGAQRTYLPIHTGTEGTEDTNEGASLSERLWYCPV